MTDLQLAALMQGHKLDPNPDKNNFFMEAVREIIKLRKLVQCCPKDDDYDGNCRIHSGRVPLERIK